MQRSRCQVHLEGIVQAEDEVVEVVGEIMEEVIVVSRRMSKTLPLELYPGQSPMRS
jgi:hypothetical protein